MSRQAPPRPVERLLERLTDPGPWQQAALGDLAEAYHRKRRRRSTLACDAWYVRQAVSLVAHRAWSRGRARSGEGDAGSPGRSGGAHRGGGPGSGGGALASDVRWAVRVAVRRPATTAAIVLTLGLGLGANAAVLGVIGGSLRAASWWAEPERTVVLWPDHAFSRGQLSIFLDHAPSYETLGGYRLDAFMIEAPGGEPVGAAGAVVSPALFGRLRVQPSLGRGLRAEDAEPGSESVVVVGHGFWQRELGGDAAALGTRILVNGTPRTVVGVQSEGGTAPDRRTELWLPLVLDPADPDFFPDISYTLVGVLRAGATPADGQADLRAYGALLRDLFPFFFRADYLQDGTVRVAAEHERALLRTPLVLLLGGTALLLLIAGLNVGNVLLARSIERGPELAVRRALGAGRGRLVRQLAVEAALLAGLAAAVALVVARPAAGAVARLFPADLGVVPAPWTPLGLATWLPLGIALTWALLAGVPVASCLSGEDARIRTRIGGRSAPPRTLVVLQSAFATVLLVAAVLLVATVANLRRVPLGFDPEGIVAATVSPPASFLADRGRLRGFQEGLVERIRALPGVAAAGMTSTLPLDALPPMTPVNPEGREVDVSVAVQAARFAVDPGFFEAMGIRLESGRLLDPERSSEPSAVVVTRALSEALWPGEEAVGRRIAIDPHGWRTFLPIVGVVSDLRAETLVEAPGPAVFVSLYERAERETTLVVRAEGGLALLAPSIRRAVRETDPAVPLGEVRSLSAVVRDAYGSAWVTMGLLSVMAAVATVLAALGVHAVLAHHVTRRRRELGVRLALGAERGHLVRRILRSGLASAGAGVALGCAGAAAAGRALEAMLFGVSPLEPAAFLLPAAFVLAVATLAALLPAVRAGRLPPGEVLRGD